MQIREGGLRISNGKTKTPIATVITVVRNGGRAIEATLQSVIKHQCDEMEYIVVDGNSTDDTLDYIKKHDQSIDYWFSEPDKGIYDAIVKGIRESRGNYCLVVNLGDLLLEFPLRELQILQELRGDVGMFSVKMSNGTTQVSRIDYRTRFANTLHHQGCFYLRDLPMTFNFQKYPHFADFDLNQRLLLAGKKFIQFNNIISYFSMDGVSSLTVHRKEYFSVIRSNFGGWWEFVARVHISQGRARMHIKTFIQSLGK